MAFVSFLSNFVVLCENEPYQKVLVHLTMQSLTPLACDRNTSEHQKDFTDQQEFDYHFKNISQVVNNPDYIGEHPVTKSVEFIKKDKERNILVAVRGKNNRLWVKTMYPIANEK